MGYLEPVTLPLTTSSTKTTQHAFDRLPRAGHVTSDNVVSYNQMKDPSKIPKFFDTTYIRHLTDWILDSLLLSHVTDRVCLVGPSVWTT